MKLRARLVVTVLLVSLPAVAALSLLGQSLRRRTLIETIYETTVARMEDGARERCEAAPARFGARRADRRGRRGSRARRIYDDRYQPTAGPARPLEPALLRELEAGEPVAAEWLGQRRVRVAMRMPWDGPCAVVVDALRARPTAAPPIAALGCEAPRRRLAALARAVLHARDGRLVDRLEQRAPPERLPEQRERGHRGQRDQQHRHDQARAELHVPSVSRR